MKKLLFSALLISGGAFTSQAQLTDGTPAPDFTATDLNGVSHTLSTYLNAGKSVILDISATWCGPCWNYHNTHALRDFYNAYGPDGSDEVMVFYIEGDDATTIADLNGTGGNTQGDWVTGTPYPILNSGAIADLYEITYFPTLYRICSDDGLVYEINQLTAAQLKSSVNTACGTLSGVQNHSETEGSEVALCSSTSGADVTLTNYGTNAITSATLILKENGTQVASTNYSGSLAQFGTTTVSFPSMSFNLASNYTVETTLVNGVAPLDAAMNVDAMSVVSADLTGLAITVKFFTDNYPAESSWNIRNSATNAIVATGGPYIGNGTSAGGADALQTKTHAVTLPAGNNCYKIEILDSYGDGLGYGTNPAGQYGMEIVSNGNSIINLDLGNFGGSFERDAAMKTDATSGMEELTGTALKVYPNPASDVLNVSFEAINSDYTLAILDLQGRIVSSQTLTGLSGAQIATFDVNELAKGSYLVNVTSNGVTQTQSVVIR